MITTNKKPSQSQRILALLKANGKASSYDLNRICYRYSARLLELRKDGHIIVTHQLKPGFFEYIYKGKR